MSWESRLLDTGSIQAGSDCAHNGSSVSTVERKKDWK
uniref:Uncharacterized protein n=1 Tax=Rhizophora mucronata TaxID=61149 RepID=A0A2P2NTK1_RHIMU